MHVLFAATRRVQISKPSLYQNKIVFAVLFSDFNDNDRTAKQESQHDNISYFNSLDLLVLLY